MAREIVRSLTTVYRDEGSQTIVRNAMEVKRSIQEAAAAHQQLAAAQNELPKASKRVVKANQDLSVGLTQNARAAQIAMRDMDIVRQGVTAGLKTYAQGMREIQMIQRAWQEIGNAKGPEMDLAGINRMRGVYDGISKSARDSAQAIEAVYEAQAKAARAFGSSLDSRFDFGSAAKSAQDSASIFERSFQESDAAAESLARSIRKVGDQLDPLAAAQSRMNDELREYGLLEAKATTEAERGILAQAKLAAQMKFRQTVQNSGAPSGGGLSSAIDNSLISNRSGVSARESAEGFQAAWKEAEQFEDRLRRIKQEIDPLAAAQDALNAKLAEYASLRAAGNISDQQLAQGQMLAQKQFEYTTRSAAGLFDQTKLGTQDMQNLQYQLNDIGVSLASGQNPFTVLLQQGAQIGQMFGPNATVGTALKSVGTGIVSFITSPITLAVLGIAALVGSFSLIYSAFKSKVKPIGDALDAQRKSVADLANGYEALSQSIIKANQSASQQAIFSERRSRAELELSARTSLTQSFKPGLYSDYVTRTSAYQQGLGDNGKVITEVSKQYAAFEKPVLALADGLEKGTARADEFVEEVAKIANQDKANKTLQEAAKRLIDMAAGAADAQRELAGLNGYLGKFQESRTRFNEQIDVMQQFGPQQSDIERINQATTAALQYAKTEADTKTILDARKNAVIELGRAARESREDVQGSIVGLDLDPVARQIANTTREYDQRIKEYKRTTNDTLGLADLQLEKETALGSIRKEATRDETQRQAGVQLQITSIGARTSAEKANIEATRARIDLEREGYKGAELEGRVQEARDLSLAQSAHEITEALRQRTDAQKEALGQLELESITLGKTAGETARLTTEYQDLAEAKRLAYEQGRDLSSDEIDNIKQHAVEIGRVTQALAEQKLAQDILDDRRQIGMSDQEARIYSTLKSAGIDVESQNGKILASQLRYNDALEQTRDIGKDAFTDIVDAIGEGTNALDSFIGALASVGKAFAKIGMDKAYDWLTGATKADAPSGGGGLGGIANAVIGSAPTTKANYTGTSLPAAATGEGFSTGKASTVAGNSVPVRMWNFFAGKGLAPHQIAGILGQAKAESNFNPTAVGDGGNAFGLFQHNDRSQNLFKSIGGKQNLSNDVAQYEFVWKELQTTEKKHFDRLLDAKDYIEANDAMIGFERPSGYQNGVKNAHNYSGRLEATKDAYQTYGSGKTGTASATISAQEDIRNQTRAVSSGVIDANTKIANGAVPGITAGDRWSDNGTDLRTVQGTAGGQSAGTVSTSTGAAPTQGTGLFSRDGMNIAGAGIGAFSNGYQSGSPLSGGLSGAFSGLGASSSIASAFPALAGAAGPIGLIGGAALGILGGILGGRAKRKEAHQQAAAKWEEVRPQYEAFDQSLSGEGVGKLRESIGSMWEQLSGFMQVGGAAWKMGTGNSSAQFDSTGVKMFAKWQKEKDEFIDGFDYMLQDLTGGEGLEGAFAKGRSQVKVLDQQVKDFIDDVDIAFGSADIGIPTSPGYAAAAKESEDRRNEVLALAKKAAGEYALTMLYTADATSDVQKALDSFKGTAAGLQDVLDELGWSAEEASADISDRLNRAIKMMGASFTEGFQREINQLSDVGYLSDVGDLFKKRDTGISDAGLLGVDPGIVTKWFQLAAQNVVDSAELTGDAFNDLIKAFPELSGVVKEFSDAATLTADQLKEQLQSLSLSSYEAAVQARADAESNLLSAYQETVSYVGGIKDFLQDMKTDPSTSLLNGKDRVDEAAKIYRETLGKANSGDREAQEKLVTVGQDYLTAAKDYYVTSEAYGRVYEEISGTLKSTATKTENQLDTMKRQASFLENIDSNQKTLNQLFTEWMKANAEAQKAFQGINQNRDWGIDVANNKKYVASLDKVGLQYTGNFGSGGFGAYLAGLSPTDRAKAKAVLGFQNGGLIPAYANGGIVGNGVWNQDSVLARFAGGGHVGLAGGEYVMPAPITQRNLGALRAMHSGGGASSDGVREEVRALREEVSSLIRQHIRVTGSGLDDTASAIRNGSPASRRETLAREREAATRV